MSDPNAPPTKILSLGDRFSVYERVVVPPPANATPMPGSPGGKDKTGHFGIVLHADTLVGRIRAVAILLIHLRPPSLSPAALLAAASAAGGSGGPGPVNGGSEPYLSPVILAAVPITQDLKIETRQYQPPNFGGPSNAASANAGFEVILSSSGAGKSVTVTTTSTSGTLMEPKGWQGLAKPRKRKMNFVIPASHTQLLRGLTAEIRKLMDLDVQDREREATQSGWDERTMVGDESSETGSEKGSRDFGKDFGKDFDFLDGLGKSWRWVKYYEDNVFRYRALHDIPPDIRLPRFPPLTNLLPGERNYAIEDLVKIKDAFFKEWVEKSSISAMEAKSEDKNVVVGERTLRIRVGTFNVNGQPPPRLLAPSTSTTTVPEKPAEGAPPTNPEKEKEKMEAERKSIEEWVMGYRRARKRKRSSAPVDARGKGRSFSKEMSGSLDFAGELKSSPTPTATTTNLEKKSKEEEVYQDEENDSEKEKEDLPPFDILALGFQELDLSTEGIFYASAASVLKAGVWVEGVEKALNRHLDGGGSNSSSPSAQAGGGRRYIKVAARQLAGIFMVVFAREGLLSPSSVAASAEEGPRFKEVEIVGDSVRTGMMGMVANKGAVGLSFNFDLPSPSPTSSTIAEDDEELVPPGRKTGGRSIFRLTFVNSHLPALDEGYEKRNWDYGEVVRRMRFRPSANPSGNTSEEYGLFESDAVIWMISDMNYRIDIPMPEVRDMLESATLPTPESGDGPYPGKATVDPVEAKRTKGEMLEWDQLNEARKSGKAFQEFQEGEINFLPTYRYSLDPVAGYDKLGYDLKFVAIVNVFFSFRANPVPEPPIRRRPAWTDRILFASSRISKAKMAQKSYSAYHSITLSDHRPVGAEFELKIPIVNYSARRKDVDKLSHILSDLTSGAEWEWDDDGNMLRKGDMGLVQDQGAWTASVLEIQPEYVSFGQVKIGEEKKVTVTVTNGGDSICGWRWLSSERESSQSSSWLSFTPQYGVLLPGATTTIEFKILITSSVAAHFDRSGGTVQLDELLVLHAINGKDHFIPVEAEYLSSCFGTSLSWLVRLPCPIRQFGTEGKKELMDDKQCLSCPREMMRLVDWLMTNALTADDIFLKPGNPETVVKIREALDTGEPFDPIINSYPKEKEDELALSFGDALCEFLKGLNPSLIPAAMHLTLQDLQDRTTALELLAQYPSYIANTVVSLTAFLFFLAQQPSKHGEARIEKLSAVFAPLLIRDSKLRTDQTGMRFADITPLGRRRFISLFMK